MLSIVKGDSHLDGPSLNARPDVKLALQIFNIRIHFEINSISPKYFPKLGISRKYFRAVAIRNNLVSPSSVPLDKKDVSLD